MPQPYPNHITPNLEIDTAAVLKDRLACAAGGLAAIAQHSMAEGMASALLTSMLDADVAPTAAIYGVIRNSKLQRDALMAVADEVLSEDRRSLLSKVLGLLQSSAKGRDQLAHSLWAVDPQFTDAVILVRPDHVWRSAMRERELNSRGGPSMDEALQMQQDMQSSSTVWMVQDMADVHSRGVRAFTGLIAFNLLLKAKNQAETDQNLATINTLFAQGT